MKRKINIWSFVFSIICILLFFIYSISGPVDYLIMSTHPLKLLLFFTLINFYFGLIGFSGVKDWKGMVRSISTVFTYSRIINVFNYRYFLWKVIKLVGLNAIHY